MTEGQRKAAEYLAQIKAENVAALGDSYQGLSPAEIANADAQIQAMRQGSEGMWDQNLYDKLTADRTAQAGTPEGKNQLASADHDARLKYANDSVQWWKDNPNGSNSIADTLIPGLILGMATGGFGLLGEAGAGAGAAAEGLAGAAGEGAGAWFPASSLATAAESSVPSWLTTAAGNAATSGAIKAGTNALQGKSLTDGLGQAVLMSGLGSAAGSALGGSNFISDGLQKVGVPADLAAKLVAPVSTGALSAAGTLAKGGGVRAALVSGLQNGTIAYGSQQFNDMLKQSGVTGPAANVAGGAGKGVISSAIKGGSVSNNALGGAVNGGINYGVGAATDAGLNPSVSNALGGAVSSGVHGGSAIGGAAPALVGGGLATAGALLHNSNTGDTPATTGNTTMPDDLDNTNDDWLNQIYAYMPDPNANGAGTVSPTGYDDPAMYSRAGGSNPTGGDEEPDISSYFNGATSLTSDPNANLGGIGGGAVSDYSQDGSDVPDQSSIDTSSTPGSAGGLSKAGGTPSDGKKGFLQSLTDQLGNVGTNANKNPLAALAALIGGAGTLRNIIQGPPSDLGKVTELMNQGNAQINQPIGVPTRPQVVGRDPSLFTQQVPPSGALSQLKG